MKISYIILSICGCSIIASCTTPTAPAQPVHTVTSTGTPVLDAQTGTMTSPRTNSGSR